MGSETLVLAIDQGTTSTRAILFDAAGQPRQSAQIALTQLHPRPGWVEHDPEEIWRSVVLTCREAIASADCPIAAVGIANQRERHLVGAGHAPGEEHRAERDEGAHAPFPSRASERPQGGGRK